MKHKYLLIILAIIVLVGITSFIQMRGAKQSSQELKSSTVKKTLPKIAIVILTKNGFSPNVVTINVGGAIRWENKSGSSQTVNSDNYPTNQLHKELNLGVFSNGSSVIYTSTNPGVYGYHNQFHHEQQGKIIVNK
jgi:plastocyanin